MASISILSHPGCYNIAKKHFYCMKVIASESTVQVRILQVSKLQVVDLSCQHLKGSSEKLKIRAFKM